MVKSRYYWIMEEKNSEIVDNKFAIMNSILDLSTGKLVTLEQQIGYLSHEVDSMNEVLGEVYERVKAKLISE